MNRLPATSTELARLAQQELARRELEARREAARIELARRMLSAFAQQAIAAGVVDGISRVDWGPHLDAVCWHTQLQLEGWLVANGPDRDSGEWPAWAAERAEMIERQRQHWERTGAVWEDSEPEPWLRYVLVQNQDFNLPPGTLKSTLVMVLANAWVWLWEPRFSFRAFSGVEANVGRDSRATRDLVRSSWYRERFAIAWATEDADAAEHGVAPETPSIDIRRDADAVEAWTTTAGGKRVSSTITSGVTGGHFDCVAGETMIATEIGEIRIDVLCTMDPMPRVWSMNHVTGTSELAHVLAWRKIINRSTIDVHMSAGNVLRCTNDHRIYADGTYRSAESCAGRAVSVLRWPESTRQPRPTSPLPSLLQGGTKLRDVLKEVHDRRGGARQAHAEERREVWSVLFDGVHPHQSVGASDGSSDTSVSVWQVFRAQGQNPETTALLSGVRSGELPAPISRPSVRNLWSDDARDLGAHQVLLSKVQGQGALHRDDGCGELELQRTEQAVLRRPVDGDAAVDQGARREHVRGVRRPAQEQSAASASHRRGSGQRSPGESHHAVPSMPYRLPSIGQATVLFATPSAVSDGGGENAVYDIQVAGNHNFFAGGVLVHNCLMIDDPDDADKVWSEPERVKPQNRYTRAIENRVNNENRSIRLVMQQRTHPEDFTAYLLAILQWSPQSPKGWAWLCIPAEYGRGPDGVPAETPYGWRDWRTEVGQTIHRLLSPGVLAHKRITLPTYEWQYNLNPKRVSDGIFARRHARFFVWEGTSIETLRKRPLGCPDRVEQLPIVMRRDELQQMTLSVDAANSLDPKPGAKVSAVGLVVGACRNEDRFVLDDRTRVLGVEGTYLAVYELLAAWAIERVLVELKALGAGVIAEITAAVRRGWYMHPKEDRKVELLGPDGKRVRCEVEPYQPGKESKPQRAHGGLPAWQAGQIFLLDGAHWLYPVTDDSRKTVDDGFIGEWCGFGAGAAKSDRVDAVSQFLARYRGAGDPREKWRAMAKLAAVGRR